MRRYSVVLIGAVLFALSGCGSSSGGADDVDLGHLEDEIRHALPSQLSENAGVDVTVESVECIAQSGQSGSCLAKVRDASYVSTTLHIKVEIDPHTGDGIWRVD